MDEAIQKSFSFPNTDLMGSPSSEDVEERGDGILPGVTKKPVLKEDFFLDLPSAGRRSPHTEVSQSSGGLNFFANPNTFFASRFSDPNSYQNPFPRQVKTVHALQDLRKELAQLKEGQFALVTFSADWCKPCKAYQPTFQTLAKNYGGRFLMIRAEGIEIADPGNPGKRSEEDWRTEYGILSFPTVAFLDRKGNVTIVKDRERPEASLPQAQMMGTASSLPLYLKLLSSKNPEARAEAARNVGRIGHPAAEAIPELIKILEDKESLVVEAAVLALGKMGKSSEDIFNRLQRRLMDPKLSSPNGLLRALGEVAKNSPPMLKRLFSTLSSSDGRQRWIGAEAIGYSGNEGAKSKGLPLIQILLNDPHPKVRVAAARGLGNLGPAAEFALPSLLKALRAESGEVLLATIWALSRFPNQAALLSRALVKMLDHPEPSVREEAAYSLSKMGAQAFFAVPALLKNLRMEMAPSVKKSHSEFSRAVAQIAIASPLVISYLTDQVDHSKFASTWQIRLIEIMENTGEKAAPAIPLLLRLALQGQTHPQLSHAAYKALENMGPHALRDKAAKISKVKEMLVNLLPISNLPLLLKAFILEALENPK